MLDSLHHYAKAKKTQIIPLGVEEPGQYDRINTRAKHGIPPDVFVVGHISRLITGKGLPQVIEAIVSLSERCPKLWLVAAGSEEPGQERDAIQLKQMLSNRLALCSTFLGRIEDQNELYACSDVLAVPSGWEGFGLVYVEAAFHGIPRIGTRMGAVPYVIKDGVDGFLVSPGSISELAEKIHILYHDNECRDALGNSARQAAVAEFSAELMARRYAALV